MGVAFLTSPNVLWARVVRVIHGVSAFIGTSLPAGSSSIWIDILKVVSQMSVKGFDLLWFFKRKMGDGALTYFWEDV